MEAPLAERIRPQRLEDYISQLHLVGENGSLTQQIARGIIPSMIFWGSPGTGKTTLAQIIARQSNRPFYEISAINSGVAAIREVIEKAKKELADLQNDPAALEKFARERYLMKRDGEDVYIIEDSLATTK